MKTDNQGETQACVSSPGLLPGRPAGLQRQFQGPRLSAYPTLVFSALIALAGVDGTSLGQELNFPDSPLRGRFVFEQKGCIHCHAVNGSGGVIGPDLGHRKFYGSFMEWASVMWNHSPEMLRRMRELDLPYPDFSRREMSELIAYLYYQRYLGEPGDLYRGKMLAREKGCLSCHSVAGRGGKSAPDFDQLAKYISPLFMAQALWNHGPAMDQEIKKRGLQRPRFEKGEIGDLSAYVRSAGKSVVRERVYMSPGKPKKGFQVLQDKGCLNCHSVNGQGSAVAPDFGQLDWSLSVTEIAALMWNHGLEMERLMERKSMRWPEFSGREMADLIAFLYFLGFVDTSGDSKAGEALFSGKGCSHCHVQGGEGAGPGPDLFRMTVLPSPSDMAAVMWNHAPAMESKVAERMILWPRLTGREMTDLYAFLQSQAKKAKEE